MVQWVPGYIFPLSVCAFTSRAQLAVLCVQSRAHPKAHRNPGVSVRMDLAHLNSFYLQCSCWEKPNQILWCVLRSCKCDKTPTSAGSAELWGWCTSHLELANKTNDQELISPNVEFYKEFILHIIFTLCLITYTLLHSLSPAFTSPAQDKEKVFVFRKNVLKKTPALPCSLIQAEFTLSFLWQPHFARHRHLAGVFIMTLIIRIDTC